MNYYLYRLKFDTAVHFGPSSSAQSLYTSEDHFCADTLFSALCHTALSLYGPEGLERLCRQAKAGKLLLSDSMPWINETLYLPKPVVSARGEQEVPTASRKAMKKLKWIPLDGFAAFARSVGGGPAYDGEAAQVEFGVSTSMAKVRILPGADSLPYQVGLYRFKDNSGLWFLAGCETEQDADFLQVLIEGLSYSGIGGKTSSGYGKFHMEDMIFLNEPFDDSTEWLYAALENSSAARQLLLSTSLPSEEELEVLLPEAEYMLTRRAGFIQSSSFAPESRRKQTQFFLSAGSVLPCRFQAELYEVGVSGRHPVYRLSAPLFLGVEL